MDRRDLVRLGAEARLKEIEAELREIRRVLLGGTLSPPKPKRPWKMTPKRRAALKRAHEARRAGSLAARGQLPAPTNGASSPLN